MLKNKRICFQLTLRRTIGIILTAASTINLLIIGAVFAVSPALTPESTASSSTLISVHSSLAATAEFTATLFPGDTPIQTASLLPTYTFTSTNTITQAPRLTPTYTIAPTSTLTLSPSPTPCTPHYSWPIYRVRRGDTLSYLAVATASTVKEIMLANCLPNDRIDAGQFLYVPRLPIETPTATPTEIPVTCIEFEDLKPGTAHKTGETFTASGIYITVGPFVWGNGIPTNSGFGYVTEGKSAGGSGMEMEVNNVTMILNLRSPVNNLSLLFGEYGGNLNIDVNGDFRNFENFAEINRLVIGGANVSVLNGFGNDTGYLQLSGKVNSFAIGGQELWIDNICTKS